MSIHETYVPGKGPNNPKIVIVGESPSHEEVNQKTPFVGSSGRFLNSLLQNAGIDRSQCWITNACKYFVPPNSKEKNIPFQYRARSIGIDLEEQYNELRTEIQTLNPNIIIALGSTALFALTGKSPIQKWRGSIINAYGYKCVPTYHPAHILHMDGEVKGFWNKPIMILDLKRALKHSYSREFNLPSRILRIAKSSADFYDFINRYRNHRYPAVDIEAYKCIPICVGISFVPHEGITIPLWNHFNISSISDNEIVNLWKMLANFLSNQDVVGQNFGYDRDKMRRLGFSVRSLYSDTMLKAFAVHPELPKNLAFLTSIYTEEPYYKDEGMYEGKIEDLLIGCARDACCTKEVDLALDKELEELGTAEYYRNFLIPLHSLYHFQEDDTSIEQIGFKIDEEIRRDLIRKYIKWEEENQHELFKLTGSYINVASPKQISDLIYNKLNLPKRKGVGEEILTQLLSNKIKNPIHGKIIELILETRRIRKTIGSYLYALPDYDGRMRTSYFLCLETGRSSTQKQEPPIRPLIEYRDEKNLKKYQSLGMAFQTITKHGDIGADVRKMFVPDDGCIFIQADSSQAEARVIFLLAEDYQALKDIDEHDYHALTASWFFGGSESDYSKKVLGYESPIRFAGKTLRHAGHLGAGKRRAAIELNTQARKNKINFRISEEQAGRALEIFHNKQPNIRGVFHAGIKRALEKDRRLVAPVPYGIKANLGGVRTFFERDGTELLRQGLSYIPQRTVSENTKAAALRIRARAHFIKILVETHDALLFQVHEKDKEEAISIIKEEMERPINFDKCTLGKGDLVIPCDIEIGYNFKDLEKFKWIISK